VTPRRGKRVKIAAAAVGIAAVVAGVALAVATIAAPGPGLQIGFRDHDTNQRVAWWTYRGHARDAVYASSGRLLHDLSFVTKERRTTTTVVNHVDKTWWRGNRAASSTPPLSASAPKSLCEPSTDLGDAEKINTNLGITTRQALSCGRFVVAGIQRVDGVRVLKLKRPGSGFVTVVIWVDSATFLPVRSVLTVGPARIQADLRWLRPAPANLAALTVPVPAGYHRLSPQD
jgi:hypothetical protein